PGPVEFGLAATAAEREKVAGLLAGAGGGRILAVPVGSSCPSRRWLPDRTAGVLDALDDATPLHAVLLGTAADAAFARAVATATRAPVLDLTGKTGLRDLIAVFERSRAVVGPDSGALHLAAALGRPVV